MNYCKITTASTSTQDQETLPDIVYAGKTTDAVTGLLMLGGDPKELDAEIDNELVMLVNKPKQPDLSKEQNKCKKKSTLFRIAQAIHIPN